jgi:hypothetical protein
MAQNVPVVLGGAVYHADFLIVAGVAFEYTLGSDFTAHYELVPNLHRGFLSIAIPPGVELLPGAGYPPRPWWGWKIPNWVHKQRLPLFYVGKMMALAAKDLGTTA